ncbi:MAG: hypothetical protein ACTSQP_22385 [Promethearchaeota archaeon]
MQKQINKTTCASCKYFEKYHIKLNYNLNQLRIIKNFCNKHNKTVDNNYCCIYFREVKKFEITKI